MEIVDFMVILSLWFILFRALYVFYLNDMLGHIAINEVSSRTSSLWYAKWDFIEAIFHPKHYFRFGVENWVRYLKARYGDK
jgi:hypothetical protein